MHKLLNILPNNLLLAHSSDEQNPCFVDASRLNKACKLMINKYYAIEYGKDAAFD